MDIHRILEDVASNKISVDDAVLMLKKEPFIDIDYAKLEVNGEIVLRVTSY